MIQIRGQCTPHGTQVVILIVTVTIRNITPSNKDDVGVRHDVTMQKIQVMAEGKLCVEFTNISILGSTLSIGK